MLVKSAGKSNNEAPPEQRLWRAAVDPRRRYASGHPRLETSMPFPPHLPTMCFLGHLQTHEDIFVSTCTVSVSFIAPCALIAVREATSSEFQMKTRPLSLNAQEGYPSQTILFKYQAQRDIGKKAEKWLRAQNKELSSQIGLT